jgi:nucleoside-diphosphate-sugar epimerase
VILILGNTGNLSSSLRRVLNNEPLMVIGRDVYSSFLESPKQSLKFMKNLETLPSYIINTVGSVDKNLSLQELVSINTTLPINLIKACEEIGSTIVTFGSVHEKIEAYRSQSKYIESKGKLFDFYKQNEEIMSRILHFQIHTWYGGKKLHKNMLLGQLADAINTNVEFVMQDGNQLREYHHLDDDSQIIKDAVEKNLSGLIEISHGEILSIATITNAVIKHFNKMTHSEENTLGESDVSARSMEIMGSTYNFRSSIPGIIKYLQTKIHRGSSE